jgi:hypothetical protein
VFAYYDQKYDFSFFERVLYPLLGGMLGVIVFSYFTDSMYHAWLRIKKYLREIKNKKGLFSEPVTDADHPIHVNYQYMDQKTLMIKRQKKIFTPHNRRIVRIWKTFGLFGIAFITPIISIPVGTIIASRLTHNKKKIFLYMLISITFWSLAMTSFFELYHVMTIKALQREMLSP